MIYDTPDWPYDLTPEQQREEEIAIAAVINATCRRIIPALIERFQEQLKRAMGEE